LFYLLLVKWGELLFELTTGIVLILIAAFFQGTFALFMKFVGKWKWENFWAVFSVMALVILPLFCGVLLVPDFITVLVSSPLDAVVVSFLCGLLWGAGSVLFGLSVIRIGLALTYSLIIGLTGAIGSVLPLLLTPLSTQRIILPFAIGLFLVFIGLAISAYSGIRKETLQKTSGFKTGLILAVISGISSSMLNIGFVYGNPILETAQSYGASAEVSTIPVWIIVLFGGFLVNFGYAAYLLIEARTFKLYAQNPKFSLILSVISGIFFFSGLVLYGIASSVLDTLGTSIGWALLMSLMIVISNLSSILIGEWKDSKEAFRYQLISLLTLILGISIMGVSLYV
jgi:L-rhamnose-H+ transport protein